MKTKRRVKSPVGTGLRTAGALLVLALVLLGCILLPPAISRAGDRKLLDRQYSQPYDLTLGSYYQQSSFLERLALYISSKDSSYATSQYVEVTDPQVVYSALRELDPELETLRSAGLLPDCVQPDLSGSSSYLGVITCMDIRDPFRTIAYRELTTADLNSGMTCFFRQDVESGKIIEFWISGVSAKTLFEDVTVDTLAERWTDYLGLQETDLFYRQENDLGNGYVIIDSEAGAYWVEYSIEHTKGQNESEKSVYYAAIALQPDYLSTMEDVASGTVGTVGQSRFD